LGGLVVSASLLHETAKTAKPSKTITLSPNDLNCLTENKKGLQLDINRKERNTNPN